MEGISSAREYNKTVSPKWDAASYTKEAVFVERNGQSYYSTCSFALYAEMSYIVAAGNAPVQMDIGQLCFFFIQLLFLKDDMAINKDVIRKASFPAGNRTSFQGTTAIVVSYHYVE